MAYALSFADDFFLGTLDADPLPRTSRPTSVLQAIMSLSDENRRTIAQDVLGGRVSFLSDDRIYQQVIETDTCTNLTTPVEVWIDRDGFYTLLVYDEETVTS